ncbi:MAG: chromate transporter [Clostridiales bacterium]|nr:chromate transporter [Clostridiales bacterium]
MVVSDAEGVVVIRPEQNLRTALGLFWYFFRIGWFTFGGGWGIVAQIQRDYVEKRGWLTEEELMNLTSVGRSVPGIMITNVSFLFGHHMAGPLGGFFSILGMMIPPVAILSAVTFFYLQFRDNVYVARALTGIRAAVVPIIGVAAWKLRKGALKDAAGYLLAAGSLALCLFTGISRILIVILGAAAGLILREVNHRGGA